MAGVDYKKTPVELRGKLAFDKEKIVDMTKKISGKKGVEGCVILSTCNRTEIYISSVDGKNDAANMLFDSCGVDKNDFCGCIQERCGEAAAVYLAEVACGLHSAILCEEQIVTQIGEAAELSRDTGCTDSVLNTLFRCAVTAGKKALTDFNVSSVPLSAAHAAVDTAEKLFGTLLGKKALVIGNGKMGLLAADALLEKKCDVCITLRKYKHGDNVIPNGAVTVDFKERYTAMEKCDFVITATRSPHYTIAVDKFKCLNCMPKYIFDLAVPCDVQSGTEKYTKCFNIDSLCRFDEINADVIEKIKCVAKKYADDFIKWKKYKEEIVA